jgi:hypothetical protein
MVHELLYGEYTEAFAEIDSSILSTTIGTLLAAWPNTAVQS